MTKPKIQGLSYYGEDARLTNADLGFIQRLYPWTFDVAEQDLIYSQMDDDYDDGTVALERSNGMHINKVAYVPGAVSLFFSRIFGLSYHAMLVCARIPLILIYGLLGFFAIRKVKTGKMILSAVALLPTTVFMSANFSYDPWITGFLLLGFAWFFGEAQRPDKKLEVRDWVIMLLAFVLGLAPKAVYFPMVALLFFMPKTKFSNGRTRSIYMISVAAVMLLMAGSMFISQGSGISSGGDMRGGSGVNAPEQISYIMNNPLGFAEVMANFLPYYISFDNSYMYMTSFAYLGNGMFHVIIVILFAAVTFTDRNEFDRFTAVWRYRIPALVLAFITVVCLAGAMYIMFTPVGADTVNGCQARYMIPVIFPVMYVLGWKLNTQNWNRNIYNTAVFSVCAFMLYLNAGYMILGRYFVHN